ncbi:hypothetical protein LTR78_002486 [Recurvomyces mirabilis]|uniref:Sulfhydryl oxidase n=1 Tax=Recurvomyces mirabilis TaxID=574656 RepID=A0AAE0WTS6_9PEZI|nr:hypothetical protein LTR78_002486 [Recurvomyces mirabilis]KAK5157415.1 hypothetical protein LTS14_004180 [Recurvomyces mirabilis]
MPQIPPRRYLLSLLAITAITFLIFLSSYSRPTDRTPSATPYTPPSHSADHIPIDKSTLTGNVIMSKLGNETAKAELGRSAWKLLHTIMSRFPDTPSQDEQTALKSYIHLFVRLYPCGECAEHFRQIVEKYPPQVSSRSSAAVWACHVHNEVNKSLGKEVFDCSKIGDFYDCGCAEDAKDEMSEKALGTGEGKAEMSEEAKERLKGNGREFDLGLVTGGLDNVKVE